MFIMNEIINETDKRNFYKKAIGLTWPIVIQNLLSAFISSADVIMLNFVGQKAIAAVSLASQATSILFMFLYGISAGAGMLCAQYYGKGDIKAIHVVEGIALRISITVATLLFLIGFFAPRYFMMVFTNDLELVELGIVYLRVVSFSFLFWSISEVYKAVLRSATRVTICTVVNIIAFTCNIIFNTIFIFGLFGAPRLGIMGVALGTSLSRFIELICCIVISVRSNNVKMNLKFMFIKNDLLFKDFVKLSVPALLNDVVWGLAFTMYSVILGHLGDDVVAANAVVSVVRNFGTVLCYGVGAATSIILGNEIGEGKLDTAMDHARCMMKLTVISAIIGGVIVLIVMPFALTYADLTDTAKGYLKIMLLINTYYIMGTAVNTTLITGVFRSGGDSKFGFICDTIDMWCYAVPLGLLAAFVFKLPVMWVYFLLCTDEFVKWPWVLKHYRSGKWVKNITRDNIMEWY